jgi:DNA-binding MarR family transcriptional regulator
MSRNLYSGPLPLLSQVGYYLAMGKAPFRLTSATQQVLHVFLAQPQQERYGSDLCRATGLESGTVHPILARLERARWLESWHEEIGSDTKRPRRRYYKLTTQGATLGPNVLPGATIATPAAAAATKGVPEVEVPPTEPPPGETRGDVCDRCGAWVSNQRQHTRWHFAVEQAARAAVRPASSASEKVRPELMIREGDSPNRDGWSGWPAAGPPGR